MVVGTVSIQRNALRHLSEFGTVTLRVLGTNNLPGRAPHNVCTPERDDKLCLLWPSSASLETRCRGSCEKVPLRLP